MDALTVVHALPGRVRLRVPPRVDDEGLAQTVSALEGVLACTWSPRTRSMLVRYDPQATDVATIADHVAAHTGAATVSGDAGNSQTPGTRLKVVVPPLFARANQRLAQATRGTLDLASGVPLLLVAWAALELVRGRTAPLAWSSALHGLFRDYNDTHGSQMASDLDRPARSHGVFPDSRI
jgi:hypothetical protein